MILYCPNLFTYDIESIKDKHNVIINCNYTEEEALQIEKNYPNIYGFSKDSIKEKLNFYNSIFCIA